MEYINISMIYKVMFMFSFTNTIDLYLKYRWCYTSKLIAFSIYD